MPIDCDAIVLSDLHLGRKGKARPNAVRRFCDALVAGRLHRRPRRVVLAGDVFENLDLRRWPDSHWQALAAIRRLERALPVTWVLGNHDGPFAALQFMARDGDRAEPVGCSFRSGDRTVMVTHGKTEAKLGADPRYGGRSGVTRREALAKLRDQWAGYDRHGAWEAVNVARGAVWYARHEQFDAAICGHSHGPFCGTLGGFPYANTGSWTHGNPATYVAVRDGTLELCYHDDPHE